MKHFVTLAALLTSLSAFAQLPYNPDANNDGHIGAVDLTSLLSVYSNNFSNGVLGEGTSILEPYFENYDPENFEEEQWPTASFSYDGSTSFVIDLSFAELNPNNPWGVDWTFIVWTNGYELINGTTMTTIIPPYVNEIIIDFETYLNCNWFPTEHRFFKWVYWNGTWYRNF